MGVSKGWYKDALRDPRWQRKRLEIMNRDGWKCVKCGDGTREQQVDHLYYERGRDPWDYPSEALQTLCYICHEIKSGVREEIGLPAPARGYRPERLLPGPVRFKTAEQWHAFNADIRGKL
jgi:5-methylcytosine-specific restriction endonuclease McrA